MPLLSATKSGNALIAPPARTFETTRPFANPFRTSAILDLLNQEPETQLSSYSVSFLPEKLPTSGSEDQLRCILTALLNIREEYRKTATKLFLTRLKHLERWAPKKAPRGEEESWEFSNEAGPLEKKHAAMKRDDEILFPWFVRSLTGLWLPAELSEMILELVHPLEDQNPHAEVQKSRTLVDDVSRRMNWFGRRRPSRA